MIIESLGLGKAVRKWFNLDRISDFITAILPIGVKLSSVSSVKFQTNLSATYLECFFLPNQTGFVFSLFIQSPDRLPITARTFNITQKHGPVPSWKIEVLSAIWAVLYSNPPIFIPLISGFCCISNLTFPQEVEINRQQLDRLGGIVFGFLWHWRVSLTAVYRL